MNFAIAGAGAGTVLFGWRFERVAYLPVAERRRLRSAGSELLGRCLLHRNTLVGPVLLLLFVPQRAALGAVQPVMEH